MSDALRLSPEDEPQHSADECCIYCTSQGERPSVIVADIELCPYQTAWAYDGLGRDGDHLT